MSSSTHAVDPKTRPAREPRSDTEYIDHGPALPRTYPGRRARSMVVGPELVRVSWEWPREGVDRWTVRAADADGTELTSIGTDAASGEAWLRVPAGCTGTAEILSHRGDTEEIIATLPFETPPDGPAPAVAPAEERWAQWSTDGGSTHELVAADAVAGAGIPDAIRGGPDAASSNYHPTR